MPDEPPHKRARPVSSPYASGPRAAEIQRLRRFARLLDASIRIPGTNRRIGVDPLIGLIPGVGDLVGAGLSGWIVYHAYRLGARRRTIARMLGYIALETTVGTIPIVGDLFDAWFRANQRSVRLLERDLATARAGPAMLPTAPRPSGT
jgi:hypothetical protein